jgi:putative addiction module killer protein
LCEIKITSALPITIKCVDAKPRKRRTYKTEEDVEPILNWMKSVRHLPEVLGRVFARLDNAEAGNFGDHRAVGEGVIELRIDFGPGYRVYLGIDGDEIILLWGGTKKTQHVDIETAIGFWRDYHA